MKHTRRLLIIPDAEAGPEAVKSATVSPSSGSSGRATADVQAEASPVVSKPKRGSRFRQYQREQDGGIASTINFDGTAVSEPVKRFNDDEVVVVGNRQYYDVSGSISKDSASGEGDILPVLTGTPESKAALNLMITEPGSDGSGRFSFNVAEEDRVVRILQDNLADFEFVKKKMPGDSQFRTPPTIFDKGVDVLASTDGRYSSIYNESPSVTPVELDDGTKLQRTTESFYHCRPKLLPLKDGRLMAMSLEATLPPHHWVVSGMGDTVSSSGNVKLSTKPRIQFLSDKTMLWGAPRYLDSSNSLLQAAQDATTYGEDRVFYSFVDAVQYSDTGEIVLVVGVNNAEHADNNLYDDGDYPPMGPSDLQPSGIDNPTIRPFDFGGAWTSRNRYLTILASNNGGESWERRSVASLQPLGSPLVGNGLNASVPGIDSDDFGVILGGACEVTESGRLLVTVCTAENVYCLSSDNRGASFRATKIKEIARGETRPSVIAYQATPPPNAEATVGDRYIVKPYDHIVRDIETITFDGVNSLVSGIYIVGQDPPELLAGGTGNPFFGLSGQIVTWDAATSKVTDQITPSTGTTAFSNGVGITPSPDQGAYIFDPTVSSGSDLGGAWLKWDARGVGGIWGGIFGGGWEDLTLNGAVVEYAMVADSINPQAGLSGRWVLATDMFGQLKREGIVLKVEGGTEFQGEFITRVVDGDDEWSIWTPSGPGVSVKTTDTVMSAGMTRSDDGSVLISVSYTDFNDVQEAPSFVSGSLMYQYLNKQWADGSNSWVGLNPSPYIDGAYREASEFINPRVHFTGRKTSIFVTSNGEDFVEEEAWSYSSDDSRVKQAGSGDNTIYSTIDGQGFSPDSPVNSGPSSLESTVLIRPDGFGQIYSATHNWMGPQFIGPQADRQYNNVPGKDPLLNSTAWPSNLGILNVVAGKTFSKRSVGSGINGGTLMNHDLTSTINSSTATSVSSGAGRDESYGILDNSVSTGEGGTEPGIILDGLDPRRLQSATPAHGTTSSYLPNGIVHPGMIEFHKQDGSTQRFSMVWGLGLIASAGKNPDGSKVEIGLNSLMKSSYVSMFPQDKVVFGAVSTIDSFRRCFGFDYEPGTQFYGHATIGGVLQCAVYKYLGGPRVSPAPGDSWDITGIAVGDEVFDARSNVAMKAQAVNTWSVSFNVFFSINGPEYPRATVSAATRNRLGKYYAGFTGGVTGVDAVQWRGKTVVISAHTSQFNNRSSSWEENGSTPGKDRQILSLGSGGYTYDYRSNDNSSLVVYGTSGWTPIRQNLGRIDNSWDIGMGTAWSDTYSMYPGQWNTPSELDAVSAISPYDGDYRYSEMLNCRNRLSRIMSGRWYQATFDGQRDPVKAGWNCEHSRVTGNDADLYLVDTDMRDGKPKSGGFPIAELSAQGGGAVLYRNTTGSNVIHLGGAAHVSSNSDIPFLPFSEGRQCAPVADGMAKTANGAPLTGGFRALFSPWATEDFATSDFKLFFSMMLNNKEWLPSDYGVGATAKCGGVIVGIGYSATSSPKYVEMQCYDAVTIFKDGVGSASSAKIGTPIRFDLPDTGMGWIELYAGFEETGNPSSQTPTYPNPLCYHAFARLWDRNSDSDWISSFSPLANYEYVDISTDHEIFSTAVPDGPLGSSSVLKFNEEHFCVGNFHDGLSGSGASASGQAGIAIKNVSLHRPGQHIKGSSAVPRNVTGGGSSGLYLGAGMFDVRAFGTSQTLEDSTFVKKATGAASGSAFAGDISTFGEGIDPRSVTVDSDTSSFRYGRPLFHLTAGGDTTPKNDDGLLSPSMTQSLSPYGSWISDGIHCGWRGSAQSHATFAVTSDYLFSSANSLSGPVTSMWKTGEGEYIDSAERPRLNQREQGFGTANIRYARSPGYVVEDVQIVLDSWGDSGEASSGDYINDVYNSIATNRQFSPTGIAIFGKNFPAFDVEFSNDDSDFASGYKLSFGLPGDGLITSNSADWFDYEPDKYIHSWAWTSEQYTVGSSPQTPIVSGGKDKFPYFGDNTFTYRTNIGSQDVTDITNIYAKSPSQDKMTPWMPSQFKSSKNGPSFYMQVISAAEDGKSDQACRYIFKIVDNTEDTIILDSNPLRWLSQYSYGGSDMSPFVGEYRSWKAVSIFSDRMASEIVYSVIKDNSKRIGDDGFITQQVPSLPGSGFRYARVTVKGCTRFGSEKSNQMGRLVLGRLMDLSGPDFEWGWTRSESSGVDVITSRSGQRYSKTNHAPRRVFNVSHHPLQPEVLVNTHDGSDSNYFEATRRGFGSSFGPGWRQEKRKWEEVVALLRSLGPGSQQAALVFEGDSALASKQPGSDNFSRTQVPTDPTSLCLVRLSSYGQMSHKGYMGREVRVPQGSQADAISSTESFGSTVCRPRPMIEVTAITFEEEF